MYLFNIGFTDLFLGCEDDKINKAFNKVLFVTLP